MYSFFHKMTYKRGYKYGFHFNILNVLMALCKNNNEYFVNQQKLDSFD